MYLWRNLNEAQKDATIPSSPYTGSPFCQATPEHSSDPELCSKCCYLFLIPLLIQLFITFYFVCVCV